jgi:hypothetical protein
VSRTPTVTRMRSMLLLVGLALSSCVDQRCSLKPVPGLCAVDLPGYAFDAKTGTCLEFVWGGCDGVRPFANLAECQQACE